MPRPAAVSKVHSNLAPHPKRLVLQKCLVLQKRLAAPQQSARAAKSRNEQQRMRLLGCRLSRLEDGSPRSAPRSQSAEPMLVRHPKLWRSLQCPTVVRPSLSMAILRSSASQPKAYTAPPTPPIPLSELDPVRVPSVQHATFEKSQQRATQPRPPSCLAALPLLLRDANKPSHAFRESHARGTKPMACRDILVAAPPNVVLASEATKGRGFVEPLAVQCSVFSV